MSLVGKNKYGAPYVMNLDNGTHQFHSFVMLLSSQDTNALPKRSQTDAEPVHFGGGPVATMDSMRQHQQYFLSCQRDGHPAEVRRLC
jgi:hypothetical protein